MGFHSFTFSSPTKVIYGIGVADKVGEEARKLNAKRVLIVTDKGVVKAGLVDSINKYLEKQGIEVIIFDQVEENPKDTTVDSGSELAREANVNLIVGLGGGSPLDTAKAVSLMGTNSGTIREYFGVESIQNEPLPLIAIPTTAGTGSEITMWAVIDDTSKEVTVKDYIGGSFMCPILALVDPLMTKSMPPTITASTGLDALTHAIEAYTSIPATPITDSLALHSIKLIANNLTKAYANGDNLEARDNMMLASLMAGMAFSNSDTAAVHAMAETVGGEYNCPHGIACAVFLPHVMSYNLIANPEKYAIIAQKMGENLSGLTIKDASRRSVRAVKNLINDLEINISNNSFGIKPEDIKRLSETAAANIGTSDNPRKLVTKDFINLFETALKC